MSEWIFPISAIISIIAVIILMATGNLWWWIVVAVFGLLAMATED